VETVKGYAAHEKDTFDRVTQARAQAIAAGSVAQQSQAENMLTQAVRSLFAVAEAYPELRANQNFLSLQEELSGTETKIAFARQFYNDIVMRYNTMRESFPGNLVADRFGFGPIEFFELDDTAAREPVKVKFN
jgi:LemA protein